MKEYILNERKYIENEVLTSTKEIEKPGQILPLLAQYYYQYEGLRKKRITELLLLTLAEKYPLYPQNKNDWSNTCDRIARHTGGVKLLEIDGIDITSGELETIAQVNDKALERLLFTLLCLAKYYNAKNPNNNGWTNTDIKDIFNLAKVKGNQKERGLTLYKLKEMGFIETPKRIDKVNLRVNFIDDKTAILLTVTDFRELGLQYNHFKGYGDYFKCEKCGLTVKTSKKNVNGKCLCKSCLNERKMRDVVCIDCGATFTVDARVAIKCRCDECQTQRNKAKKLEWQRRKAEQKEKCSKVDNPCKPSILGGLI